MFIESDNITETLEQYSPVAKPAKKERLFVETKYLCMCSLRFSYKYAQKLKERNVYRFRGTGFIDLNSIPPADRAKYGISQSNEKIVAVIAILKQEEVENKQRSRLEYKTEGKVTDLNVAIYMAKGEASKYYNLIRDTHKLTPDRCRKYAERWAVWVYILSNYKREGQSLDIYHSAYSRLFPEHFTGKTSKNAFSNFMYRCTTEGIENCIVDKRAVVKVQKRRSAFQLAFLQNLYIQNRKITRKAAYNKLVAACAELGEKPMSEANVKIIFREFENNAELHKARYGEGAAAKQLPFVTRLPALHRNSQWVADGWVLPFWGAEFQRYTLDIIRDNHSRKIIGYAVGKSENTEMKLATLETAMRETGVWPGEIVMDKHSWTKTAIADRLRADTEKMGAIWSISMEANRNTIAERYNQHLDSICSEFEGYLGKNLTATSKDARPSPETLATYAKTANFKSEAEIKAIAAYVVTTFNNTKLEVLGNATPNEKYEASESLKAYKLTETEILRLLRPVAEYKVTRGQIMIKVGGVKHEFQLNAALIARYNNRLLHVVYEDLREGIYITDPQTGEELGCVTPKPVIHSAMVDQTDQDRELLNKHAGRKKGTQVKARKTAQQRLMDGLKENPEAIDRINHYALPKDIRQEAAQNAELRKQLRIDGVNVDKLPIRASKANTILLPETKAEKSKKSPFAPVGNVIKRLSIEDLLNDMNQQ